MKRFTILVFVLLFGWALGASPALAQQGAVAQRAVDGAKQYVKKHNMKNPTQKMLLNSLFRNAMPDFVQNVEGINRRPGY